MNANYVFNINLTKSHKKLAVSSKKTAVRKNNIEQSRFNILEFTQGFNSNEKT